MRKVNVLEFVSLDGVIQAPGGPEEACFRMGISGSATRVWALWRKPVERVDLLHAGVAEQER